MLGVSRAALLCGGCREFTRQPYGQTVLALGPIGYWRLDEAGGTTIVDARSVQNGGYHGAIEFGVAPIVDDSSGTSIGLDGVGAYGDIPHNPAFAVDGYTVDFAFQVDTAPAVGQNRVLLSKDIVNPAPAGALSIEIFNAGDRLRLRAYAGGAAGDPIWIGGPAGVADLDVGVAYKVTLTVDEAAGAKLYLDGTEVASEPSATIGWTTNAEPIVIGAYSTAALGKFDGVLDAVALFDRALSPSDLVELARATTVARSTLPLIPTLDFLPSDGMVPEMGVVYVFDTALGDGSGSDPTNAQEIQAGLNAATPGQTLVAIASSPGGTSFYDRPAGSTALTFLNSGQVSNPITLMARPGDTVVIDGGQEFAQFRTPSPAQGTAWELYDGALKIWRSVSTGFGATPRPLGGHWLEFGWPHYILPAPSLAALSAPLGRDNIWTNYGSVCACVHTDGRVYIRMQKPDPNKMSFGGKWPKNGVLGDWPGWANASGEIDFPVSEDPRDYAIWLTYAPGGTAGGTTFLFDSGVSNVIVGSGINSFGHELSIWLNGDNDDVTLGRGTDLATRFGIFANTGDSANLTLLRRRMGVGSHRHCPLLNWKFGGPLEGGHRGAWCETNWQSGGAILRQLSATDCTFYGFHDFVVRGGPDWKFQNCTIYRIFDDGSQDNITVALRNEYHHCYLLDSAFGGPGGLGRESSGSWKVSHCIIDMRLPKMIDVGSSLDPYSEPYSNALAVNHVSGGAVARATKWHNNTVLTAPDRTSGYTGFMCHLNGVDNNVAPAEFFEHWNCIQVTVSADRYTGNGGLGWLGHNDDVAARMIVSGVSRETYDYIMLHRDCPPAPMSGSGFASGFITAQSTNGAPQNRFDSLALWKASTMFFVSQANVYAPGFLANAVEADPQIPSAVQDVPDFDTRRDYRPRNPLARSAARTDTTTTIAGESTAGWTVVPSPWLGALDPVGTDMPVGVQNP